MRLGSNVPRLIIPSIISFLLLLLLMTGDAMSKFWLGQSCGPIYAVLTNQAINAEITESKMQFVSRLQQATTA